MRRGTPHVPSRRQFLVAGAATAAAIALVDGPAAATSTSSACAAGSCVTSTAWMLEPDWGYPRGPHAKTHLVSRASRSAATNRIVRSEEDALATNLHLCSWAPAVQVPACSTRLDAAFEAHARQWQNPWNGTTVSLIDLRWLPPDTDLFTCPENTSPHAHDALASAAPNAPGGLEALAFSGSGTRRLLFAGIVSVVAGAVFKGIHRRVS